VKSLTCFMLKLVATSVSNKRFGGGTTWGGGDVGRYV
jgi:hypothetical protein